MKLLTGKCETEFEKYIESLDVAPYVSMLDNIPSTYLNALIIDFFDSVGICILIDRWQNSNIWLPTIQHNENECLLINIKFDTRQQATEEAIKMANEIFNNR